MQKDDILEMENFFVFFKSYKAIEGWERIPNGIKYNYKRGKKYICSEPLLKFHFAMNGWVYIYWLTH